MEDEWFFNLSPATVEDANHFFKNSIPTTWLVSFFRKNTAMGAPAFQRMASITALSDDPAFQRMPSINALSDDDADCQSQFGTRKPLSMFMRVFLANHFAG